MIKRLDSIDALRGLAVVFMVINHAGHYLTPSFTPAWAYYAIYLTVTLAAPLFLFLAGVSLALSIRKERENGQAGANLFLKYLKRGLALVGLGLLINIFFYFNEPLWRGRVLMAIGLSIIIAYPFYSLMLDRSKRLMLLAASICGLMVFPLIYPALQSAAEHNKIIADIFLSEFPIYPWFLLVLIGMICAREFILPGEIQTVIRKRILNAGALLLISWLALSLAINGADILSFVNDYNLNGYWNPSPLTWLWIFGWLVILAIVFYGLENNLLRNMLRSTRPAKGLGDCLALMGRNALLLYFLQFFLIITIGQKLLKLQIYDIVPFVLVNSIIIIILCVSATYKKSVRSIISDRLGPKARIS
ncbi:MAG: heparan-alpha-glucosaminide N-acetyltransferase domain-containing protein [Candidatus Buchananbacteria bacterium]|jgi:uncharacterized membrane protein